MGKHSSILALLFVAACGAPLGQMPEDATDVGTSPESGTSGEGGEAEPLSLASRYELHSQLDVKAGALAPEPAYELLDDLYNDPGQALVTLADAAGVPAAQTLFDALPSSLESKIEDWMSDALRSDGLEELQVLMAWSQLVLANIELSSELELGVLDAEGHTVGSHHLRSLGFRIDGDLREVAIASLPSLPGAGHSEVELWLENDASLVFGEQRYGLLLGEAAFLAMDQQLRERKGTDLRGLLGRAIPCDAMAQEVADQCVLGVCVGHQSELEGLCNGALDQAADTIRDQFRAFDMELLVFRSGEATLGGSGAHSQLDAGEWQAEAELGQGLRALPGRFDGQAMGE